MLSFMSFVTAAIVLGGIGLFAWGMHEYAAPGPLAETKSIIIAKGEGVAAIARDLGQEGIIDPQDALLFRAAARLTGRHKDLKAGEYEFAPGISIADILDKLAHGDVMQRRFTVREGLTSWQVVQILNQTQNLEGEISDIPAEGSLLPDTYQFTGGDSRAAKIEQMQKAMAETLDQLWAGRDETIPVLSKEQAVILASIVEKETGVPGERARIAAVFENRLKQGIPLQSDPTVIYALTNGKIQDEGMGPLGRRLLSKDLDVQSPYNTYKNPGLPPGPIANPGIDSLKAVLHPEKNDYLYFVADGTGGHVFSKTLAEHNANVAKWRDIRKKSGN